jgi:hypothetical protein
VHKSVLVQGRVDPQPVWTNRNSSSQYKVSIWQVACPPQSDTRDLTVERSGSPVADRFFVAVAGHDPPTTPVYAMRPGAAVQWQSSSS